jgi:hypothetical protein
MNDFRILLKELWAFLLFSVKEMGFMSYYFIYLALVRAFDFTSLYEEDLNLEETLDYH